MMTMTMMRVNDQYIESRTDREGKKKKEKIMNIE